MKQIQMIGLIYLFFSAKTFGQTPEENTGMISINDTSYFMRYPENWELNNSGQMGMSLILLSELSSPEDLFRENVNLLIQDLKGQNIDLNKYVEISKNQVETMFTNGNLLESKRQSANGTEFHKFIYTGDLGSFKLKFEQYCWVKNKKGLCSNIDM